MAPRLEMSALGLESGRVRVVPYREAWPALYEAESARTRTFLVASAAVVQAGYAHRGEQGIAGRDVFRRGEPRQYHVHLTTIGSTFWNDHRQFREHLRSEPAAARAYEALKHELAARYPTDRESYIEGKTGLVQATLAAARGAA